MLEARSLTKYYSHTAAVKNVSFAIRPGEILGYLGPNGAGKSTTVKMITRPQGNGYPAATISIHTLDSPC
jgi:ABC-type multidrug transport system ATPase subunit